MKFKSGFISNSSSSSYVLVLEKDKYDEIVEELTTKFDIDEKILENIITPSDIFEDLVMVSGGSNEDGSYINNYYNHNDEEVIGEFITEFENELDKNSILSHNEYH